MSSKNLVPEGEGTCLEVVEAIVKSDADAETLKADEFLQNSKCTSMAKGQVQENEEHNGKEGCEFNVQMNVGNGSIQSIVVLANKNRGEPSIENDKASEVQKSVDHSLMRDCKNPLSLDNDEGKKEVIQDPQVARCSGLPRAVCKTASIGLDGSGSSDIGRRLVKISKEIQPRITSNQANLPCTDVEEDETLAEMLIRESGHAPPRPLIKSSAPTTLSLNAMKVTIQRGAKAVKLEAQHSMKSKNKRKMQPFAVSPMKRQNLGRTPLDACLSFSKWKLRTVPSLKEDRAKAILRVKKEKREGKLRRSTTSRQVQEEEVPIQNSSSENMEDTSDEDVEWGSKGDCSGAEVKGDSDYKP